MTDSHEFDLVVLGGGPAGSTLSTFVAMQGHRVLLLEKERFPRHQLGESLLPSTDVDVHLCGPAGFMQDLYAGLRLHGVADADIHAEAFGPAGLQRDDAPALPLPATQAVPVRFAVSGKEARWTPETGALLDLAESRGLSPAHSCRQGICGSCSHALTAGTVTYAEAPAAGIAPGQVLLCRAVPAEGSGPLVIEA